MRDTTMGTYKTKSRQDQDFGTDVPVVHCKGLFFFSYGNININYTRDSTKSHLDFFSS